MLVLLFLALWFILQGDLFYILPCVILFLCFLVLMASIAITSLGEERANLSASRTFVRFALVWFCLFPLPRCLGRTSVCYCGYPWTILLPFIWNDIWVFLGCWIKRLEHL